MSPDPATDTANEQVTLAVRAVPGGVDRQTGAVGAASPSQGGHALLAFAPALTAPTRRCRPGTAAPLRQGTDAVRAAARTVAPKPGTLVVKDVVTPEPSRAPDRPHPGRGSHGSAATRDHDRGNHTSS